MKKKLSAADIIKRKYLQRLGLSGSPDQDKIHAAYRAKAKKLHPDLYPDRMKLQQQLVMMQLNEAYMALQNPIAAGTAVEMEDASPSVVNATITELKNALPARNKDPGYPYYKIGFKYYSRATALLTDRKELKTASLTTAISGDKGALKLATRALKEFEQAFRFFLKVVEEYPQSIWRQSALEFIEKIQLKNKLYNRICRQIINRSRV